VFWDEEESMQVTTRFQAECVAEVKRLLSSRGKTIDFKPRALKEEPVLNQSEGDVALVGCFESEGSRFEVWVYPDEAGFYKDGSWSIAETTIGESADALLRGFLETLEASINRGPRYSLFKKAVDAVSKLLRWA